MLVTGLTHRPAEHIVSGRTKATELGALVPSAQPPQEYRSYTTRWDTILYDFDVEVRVSSTPDLDPSVPRGLRWTLKSMVRS